jgi:hypothetical protein
VDTPGSGGMFRRLLSPVGNGRDNRQEDVLGVKHALHTLGRYVDPTYGMTGYIDVLWSRFGTIRRIAACASTAI